MQGIDGHAGRPEEPTLQRYDDTSPIQAVIGYNLCSNSYRDWCAESTDSLSHVEPYLASWEASCESCEALVRQLPNRVEWC